MAPLCAATVTATWNANPETDIAGYRLSYGTASGVYTTVVDVGNVTSYVLSGLVDGTNYYFAVQAYNTAGLVSAYSTEVAYTVSALSAPTITSLSPTSGTVGTGVTITGANFGSTQGISTVAFNGTTAAPTSWSASSIGVPVPAGATTGNVVVTVGGVASNGATFTVTAAAPTITSLSPTSGTVGTSVTIAGSNFGSTRGSSTVAFNGTMATPTGWSASSIVVPVPTGASTGNVVVTVGGVASNSATFTLTGATPTITSITPASGAVGTSVTVDGTGFGPPPAVGAIAIDATASVDVATAAASVTVPAFSTTAANELLLAFVATDYNSGTNTTVTSVSGAGVTWQLVQRANVQAGTSEIWRAFAPTAVSNASITATLSQSVASSMTVMSVSGVDVSGTNGSGAIGATASGNASSGAPTGTLTTTRNNSLVIGVGNDFDTATARTLGSNQAMVHQDLQNSGGPIDTFWVQRTSGTIALGGTQVTINDISPSTDRYNLAICEILAGAASTSTVSFNGTAGAPTSWSDTSITVPVPNGATTGDVVVDADGAASNGVMFTVTTSTSSAPAITSVTPGTGSVGTVVTIAGSNFGSTQGTSRVTFNGTVATPTSWSATSITVPVPAGATTGNVVVTVGGAPSNGAAFTVIAPFTFNQVNYATPSTATTVTVAYNAAQTAGDTNIVVVGWSDTTAVVQSVTDAMGNQYAAVVGPTKQSGIATQVIYVATQIAAAAGGANLVTVTFSGAARLPDVRIAEYGGIDPVNPVDVTGAAQGNGTTATLSALATTNAADLVVAADLAQAPTLGAGYRFTSRVITSPNGDILEDRAVTAVGTYRIRASLSASAQWIMQGIAFRAAVVH